MTRPVHFVAGFNTDSTCYCGVNLAEQPDDLVMLDPDKVTCESALEALGLPVTVAPDVSRSQRKTELTGYPKTALAAKAWSLSGFAMPSSVYRTWSKDDLIAAILEAEFRSEVSR